MLERKRAETAWRENKQATVYFFDAYGTMQTLFHETPRPTPKPAPAPERRRQWREVLCKGPDPARDLEEGEWEYVRMYV